MAAKKIAKKAAPAPKKKVAKKAGKTPVKTAAKKQAPKKTKAANLVDEPIGLINTIPVQDAINYTQSWCDYNVAINQQFNSPGNDYIRAFFVQKEDIKGLNDLLQSDSDMLGCRFYLGMNLTETAAVNPAFNLKLLMVAVINDQTQPNGIDVVFSPNTGESMVYDFTSPCPSTCDMVSVLYHNGGESLSQSSIKTKKRNRG